MAKKIDAIEWNLEDKKPKVLLLGNGINRAFDFESWDGLLDIIKDEKYNDKKAADYDMPMPLKATLLTENNLVKSLNDQKDALKSAFDFEKMSEEEKTMLSSILKLKFDYVLTTNYTYELEYVKLGRTDDTLLEQSVCFIPSELRKGKETKYYLSTFNMVDDLGIWHIHGEMRNAQSIIANHNGYCRLAKRYMDEADKVRSGSTRISATSWVHAFLYGDVYILGFGCGYDELDIWWLLNKKRDLKTELKGKTIFFDIKNPSIGSKEYHELAEKEQLKIKKKLARNELMKVLGVECENLISSTYKYGDYIAFYKEAINKMKGELEGEK